ncbi:nicotinate-nucleotide adenylyltransferase [Paenibacillus alvei]|uniref:Probable nicotinate-nucleotide adenylyltransferase n=1 Tax=Paenibacillus alvei TaxID=44250 RepID=A0ABT4GUF8_PAEAL|nr:MULTISPECIES: nicotinate-nucleotide adenylyltransferase [Paenibacillus]EJW17295.1 putative nicotinate-nucleotide adenylyltransferase NadD [Paenibacillus alvei DSM 29]MCY9542901.1 nicotinate-nucleotide adenylyltransferase [Paenibacillus alvei]MCY9706921.1 nicotinate-nucleotide adenylyltransferase [Paenibacillus alvei]MCY9735154.1 nicotinate-nucleotide adenylyltransferase [Paenibacillus alvei]MCY9753357.1 nicotinate-nucleotide adenylyltransferase [Paenibacillus alvei]
MKFVGIMGGTFDPIHLGHLVAAECARETASLDEVWFMPAHVPPHKSHRPSASAEQRLEMAKLAVQGNPHFRVCDWEIRHGGVSYTLDTVKGLREEYPDTEWAWIIGGDMVAYLPQWHHIDELMEQIRFIGLHRPGSNWDTSKIPASWASRLIESQMPQMDISSTDIRQRIAEGRSIAYIVPDQVQQYIARWGLYESDTRTTD